MSSTPTRGAGDEGRTGWVQRPFVARLVRVVLFVIPMVVGWLAVRYTKQWYWSPEGWRGVAVWVAQAIVVAGLASSVATRIANRFAPLSALFRLTLIFPDHAPSRFGVALRGGTIKKLSAATTLSSTSVQAAAEQAVALVAERGRHERRTRGHTERVRAHAELIGIEMGLAEDDMQRLRWGVLLHDIGKLTVPPEILNKESALTEAEWAVLRQHPDEGARIIAPLAGWLGPWADAASQHHERWDGKGYPAGLSGTDISLSGRITAVADAYDVITSKRSYKEAMSVDAARNELVRCSGDQFDPAVVRAALQIGLREPKRLGLMSWLLELPSLARVASSASTVPVAAATAAVSVVASLGGIAVVEDPPEAIALAEPEPVVIAAPTTTTTVVVPSSTTSAPTTTSTTTTTTTTLPPPIPSGTGVEILIGEDVPASVEQDVLESNTITRVLQEEQLFTLGGDLTVRTWTEGAIMNVDDPGTAVIPAGTVVCSWFVHTDVTDMSTLVATVDFGSSILGLAIQTADLNATAVVENDEVTYGYTGLENADTISVSGSTMTLNFEVFPTGRDQVRVITAC